MDLTLETPGEHNYIRSFSDRGIQIAEQFHKGSLLVSATQLIEWPPCGFRELEDQHLQTIIDLEPEVVLIGTGARQQFLSPQQMMQFYAKGIGIEVMSTDAACRTFNVLVSDGRNVVAGLIQDRDS